MAHNSAVLAEFDNAMRGYNNLIAGPGSELQEAAIKVRIYCTFSRGRVRMWLWLPNAFCVVAPPRLARLRKAAGLDGPNAYEELKTARPQQRSRSSCPLNSEALTRKSLTIRGKKTTPQYNSFPARLL